VAVEKLFLAKFAKIKLRQDALWAIFSDRETFCIPQISTVFDQKGVFQQPRLFSTTTARRDNTAHHANDFPLIEYARLVSRPLASIPA
jgi:hypothetical protein